MGLSPAAARPGFATAVAPAATGILDPSTGRPVGANDPYFLEVNHELSDKGFFVAATDDLSEANMRRAVVYGCAMGSFAVEKFSNERTIALTRAEIDARVVDFRHLVSFESELPVGAQG